MKNSLLALFVAFTFSIEVNAQNKTKFEGVITYAISFENSGLPTEILDMLKGSESIIYIKGNKRRIDFNTTVQILFYFEHLPQ